MAYTPSIREIPLTDEPMASAIEAVLPEEGETEMRWDNATAEQIKLLEMHPEAKYAVGTPQVTTETVVGEGGVTR
jgi:hypothetical protein